MQIYFTDKSLTVDLKSEWNKIGSELANEKIATLEAVINLINLRNINFSVKENKNKFTFIGKKEDLEILKKELNAVKFLKEDGEL